MTQQVKRDEIKDIISAHVQNFLIHTNYLTSFDLKLNVLGDNEDKLQIEIKMDDGDVFNKIVDLPSPYFK